MTTPDQFRALRDTQLAYRDALNYVSAYSFAHRKTSSGKRLQKATYADLRSQFGLPAQMACNVPRQVGVTYQALWTKAKKNAEARRLGYTKRRFKGLDQAPHYVSPTLSYNLGRDYSLRTGQEVSLLALCGRIHLPYQGWSRHVALLQAGATIGGAKLWYDRGKQRFFLLVSLTLQTPDPTPECQRQVVGVDVGQRYLATVATLDNGAQFSSGKEIRAQADHYARVQKRLQRKGTRSATRRRIAIGQADETVEAEYQPYDQQAHPGHPSPCLHRARRALRHPRSHQAPARQEGHEEAAPRQPAREQVGLCGVARAAHVQGSTRRVAVHQGGCRLHQPGLPTLCLHQP